MILKCLYYGAKKGDFWMEKRRGDSVRRGGEEEGRAKGGRRKDEMKRVRETERRISGGGGALVISTPGK